MPAFCPGGQSPLLEPHAQALAHSSAVLLIGSTWVTGGSTHLCTHLHTSLCFLSHTCTLMCTCSDLHSHAPSNAHTLLCVPPSQAPRICFHTFTHIALQLNSGCWQPIPIPEGHRGDHVREAGLSPHFGRRAGASALPAPLYLPRKSQRHPGSKSQSRLDPSELAAQAKFTSCKIHNELRPLGSSQVLSFIKKKKI